MLRKIQEKTFNTLILLTVFFTFFALAMVGNASANGGAEVPTVTAIVDDEGVVFGDPNADEGVGRGQSHFPKNPELYIPEPMPKHKESAKPWENGREVPVTHRIEQKKEQP